MYLTKVGKKKEGRRELGICLLQFFKASARAPSTLARRTRRALCFEESESESEWSGIPMRIFGEDVRHSTKGYVRGGKEERRKKDPFFALHFIRTRTHTKRIEYTPLGYAHTPTQRHTYRRSSIRSDTVIKRRGDGCSAASRCRCRCRCRRCPRRCRALPAPVKYTTRATRQFL